MNRQSKAIRIVICSDIGLAREGIAYTLASDDQLEVVAQASSWSEAPELAASHNADIVIVNSNQLSPLEIVEQIKDRLSLKAPRAKIISLSHSDNAKLARATLRAGTFAYTLASDSFDQLKEAIWAASQGNQYISQTIAIEVARLDDDSYNHLSNRESEVLRLLAHGYTNKEVGDLLFLSQRTIENHRIGINQKLGFKYRHQLVSYALSKGLMIAPG